MISISDSAAISDAEMRMSGRELRTEVHKIAHGLVECGLRPGDRVLVLGRKSVQLAAAVLGVPAAGGVVVAPYLGLSATQLRHIFVDTAPTVAIVLDSAPRAACGLAQELIRTFSYAMVRENAGRNSRPLPDPDSNAPALIIFTSGSTGKPKGVVFSHENIRLGAESVAQFYGLDPSDRVLCLLPFCFDAGLNQFLSAIMVGCEAYLREFLLPQHTASVCGEHGITTLTGVPALWRQLAGVPWPAAARKSMRRWGNTGGHMPVDLSRALCDLFPDADPLLMYGFTEAFRATYLPSKLYRVKPTSVGVAIPHAAVAVIGETGRLCESGELGELVQFGPLVTLGYWNRPEDTQSKYAPLPGRALEELRGPACERFRVPQDQLDRVVWSGDTVMIDEGGCIHFHSRRSTLIKSQGFRVSPTEIEDACRETGLVRDAVAFGIDCKGDEAVAVAVIPALPDVGEEQLWKKLSASLPSFQVPRVIAFRQEIPLTSNGKYDVRALKEELAGKMGQGW